MRILIVAAKTGGHVFPASSIAKELILNNHRLFLELVLKLRRMHTKIYLLRHIIFQFRVIEMKI